MKLKMIWMMKIFRRIKNFSRCKGSYKEVRVWKIIF